MSVEYCYNNWRDKPKYSEGNLFTTNPTRTAMGLNLSLGGDKPASIHLSDSTANITLTGRFSWTQNEQYTSGLVVVISQSLSPVPI